MSKIRICPCCGRTYKYCPTCGKDPVWKMLYDTETCREISNLVSAYSMKRISKERAQEELNQINYGNISIYNEEIARVLTELTNVPAKRRRRKK